MSSEHALAQATPLGFSGDDVLQTLQGAAGDVVWRWDSGEPVAVTLAFSAEARVAVVERLPAGEAISCASPVLRLDVSVTLSSERQGISGTWDSQLSAAQCGCLL